MKKILSLLAAVALLFACTEETVDPNGGKEMPGGDKTVHVTGVSLDRTSVTIKEGESVTLVATVKPDNADNKTVSWSSSDTAVASVDNSGKVIGVKAGSATVTAKTEDGEKTASCVVTVAQEELVDLGLSVKWRGWNLGASKPEEYGDYYAWGETSLKDNYFWSTYKWCNGSYNSLTKYNTSSNYGTVDNKTVLELEDDVAHVVLGGNWRMPTDAEWTELRDNCTWTWTSDYNGTGVAGRIVTSNKTGYTDKSIFLPAAGYRLVTNLYFAGSSGNYWSSSLDTDEPDGVWLVGFDSGGVSRYDRYRYYGFSFRPVSE